MIQIYHFANTGYGLSFLEKYAQFPLALMAQVEVKVVLSAGMGKPPRSPIKKIVRSVRQAKLQRAYRQQFAQAPFQTMVSQNVNSPQFIRQIPEGSIGVCSGFDQIFSAKLIDRFTSFINVHPSVLPYYRGPIPSYWCIQNKEVKTGFTIHRVTTKIDAGEILFQKQVAISSQDTEQTLDQKIAVEASKQLLPWFYHKVEGKEWSIIKKDAAKVYLHYVNYRSFAKGKNIK